MLGAIIGDLAGTKYEYQEFLDSRKNKINFERRISILNSSVNLISENSFVSDDTILTTAISEAIIYGIDYEQSLKKYGIKYGNKLTQREGFFKNAFSPTFIKWANQDNHETGCSKGNGSAMRVSPTAYLFNDLDRVQLEAKKSAIPSHNSPEGIKRCTSISKYNLYGKEKI